MYIVTQEITQNAHVEVARRNTYEAAADFAKYSSTDGNIYCVTDSSISYQNAPVLLAKYRNGARIWYYY